MYHHNYTRSHSTPLSATSTRVMTLSIPTVMLREVDPHRQVGFRWRTYYLTKSLLWLAEANSKMRPGEIGTWYVPYALRNKSEERLLQHFVENEPEMLENHKAKITMRKPTNTPGRLNIKFQKCRF